MKLRTMIFLVFLGASLIVSFFISHAFYRQESKAQAEELRRSAACTAQAVALMLNGQQHSFISSQEDMQTDEYKVLQNQLENFRSLYPKARHIYTVSKSDIPGQWKYTIDAEGIIPPGTEYKRPGGMDIDKIGDTPAAENEVKTDETGSYISAYAPVFNMSGHPVAVLRIDMTVDAQSDAPSNGFVKRIFPILFGSVILSLILSFVISYLVADPLAQIIDTTKLISQGKFSFLTTKKRKDEVGTLIQSVNEMSKNIKSTIEKLTTLNKTAETLAMNIDYEESIKVAMNLSMEIVGASKGIILTYNKSDNIFSIGAISGMATAKVVGEEFFVEMDKFSLKPENNVMDFFSSKPDIYTLSEVEGIPQLSQMRAWLVKTGMTLIAPLMIKRELRGIIILDAAVNDKDYLKTLINQISMSIENARLYREAIIDDLTGLFMYRYFEIQLASEIRRAARFGKKLSVMLIDFDNFKKFNDDHGHMAGNFVIKETAKMIKQLARSVDIIARYGGEEIAILLPETDTAGATIIAEKIRSKVEETEFVYQFKKFRATVSAGIAEWNTDSSVDAQTLVSWADEAMIKAKKAGRNRVERFEV